MFGSDSDVCNFHGVLKLFYTCCRAVSYFLEKRTSSIKARLIPPVQFSLEEALEYIKEDEYVEVTPKSMRMRKVILEETERKRANKN